MGGCYSKYEQARRMNEGDLFAILIGSDPFWLVQTLRKTRLRNRLKTGTCDDCWKGATNGAVYNAYNATLPRIFHF